MQHHQCEMRRRIKNSASAVWWHWPKIELCKWIVNWKISVESQHWAVDLTNKQTTNNDLEVATWISVLLGYCSGDRLYYQRACVVQCAIAHVLYNSVKKNTNLPHTDFFTSRLAGLHRAMDRFTCTALSMSTVLRCTPVSVTGSITCWQRTHLHICTFAHLHILHILHICTGSLAHFAMALEPVL